MIKYILNREKKFDKYIIAYIDFLGIKQKMNTNCSYESLQILKFFLWGIQRTTSYISSINEIDEFDIKIFSDNIVIAQKVNEGRISDQITSLIEAYAIENNLANYPRVIVSKKILNAYDECKNKSLNLYALIKEDFDGLWFVDFMLAAPNITLIPTIARILQEKADFYANENDRVKQKINWMISYFNSYCIAFRDRGDYDGYVLSLI